MLVQVLVDNPDSWIIPYAQKLVRELHAKGINSTLLHDHSKVVRGDILCLLSCEKIFKNLNLNEHNLVVHESELPKGRGWSPMTWQILEGSNVIPITLFEASEKVDSGVIYDQKIIELTGCELLSELRHIQGEASLELITTFVVNYPKNSGSQQIGKSSYYRKRTPDDSELDVSKTIEEQFNLLRVCDNKRYPAFFTKGGIKYILQIEKADD